MNIDITEEELRSRIHANPEPTTDRERFCELCGARVTESVDGQVEYGHYQECPDRPDEFPRAGRKKGTPINGGEGA